MLKKFRDFPLLIFLSIVPTILIWLPFYFRLEKFWNIPLTNNGMATIVANYDGPLFLAVAKTFYNTDAIRQMFSFPLANEYFAAHFPLFPLLIKLFAGFFGYPYSMLFVTALSSFFAIYIFYKLAGQFVGNNQALVLTAVFSIFPARWLIVRSVGSAEPLFISTVIASVYFFRNKNYLLSGIFGVLAQLTKSPAILLPAAYFLSIFIPEIKKMANLSIKKWSKTFNYNSLIPVILIPMSLIAVFIFYKIRLNDFLAYFHSGDNIHLLFPPFQIFNYSAPWVGTFWLEEVIFIYLFAAVGFLNLIKQKYFDLACVVGVFFLSILFVSHRDIMRYSLPIVPFLLIAFKDSLLRKEFLIVMGILLIPIYLFSLSYISQNVMPISDWTPFL